MENRDRIQLLHPDPTKQAPRIGRAKYEMVKAALLKLAPQDEAGYPFRDLADGVASLLSEAQLAELGSVGWYTTAVKLDLEARGLLERAPGRGAQRVRRPSGKSG